MQNVGKDEQIRTAQAQVDSARGRLASAQAQVAYAAMPQSPHRCGDGPSALSGRHGHGGGALLTVMDVSKVVARINMSQDKTGDIHVGNDATLTPTDGGEPVPGKVTIISPATDPNSTTVQVWVQADNPGERLRAGQRCMCRLPRKRSTRRRSCRPRRSSPTTKAGTIVKVVDAQNVAHDRPVQVGAREPEMVQVSGRRPGRAGRHGGGRRPRRQVESHDREA